MNLNTMEIVWIVWGVSLLAWLIMLGYQAKITSNEEDQLFLTGNQESQHQEQLEIISKVQSIQPVLRGLLITTCVLTLAILGYYVKDALQHLM